MMVSIRRVLLLTCRHLMLVCLSNDCKWMGVSLSLCGPHSRFGSRVHLSSSSSSSRSSCTFKTNRQRGIRAYGVFSEWIRCARVDAASPKPIRYPAQPCLIDQPVHTVDSWTLGSCCYATFQNGSVSGRSGQRHVIISSWNLFFFELARRLTWIFCESHNSRVGAFKLVESKTSNIEMFAFQIGTILHECKIVNKHRSRIAQRKQIASAPFNTPIANGFVKRFVYTLFMYEHTSKTCPLLNVAHRLCRLRVVRLLLSISFALCNKVRYRLYSLLYRIYGIYGII